ncbi:hypothetical protein FB451DRAFT_1096144 [Mycena latifolia]|nr:hypothetical protein FB451DRAFT_1096144 [Mycena latifolia]
MTDRSTSRGRDALTSSGRGGLGNIHPSPSPSRPTTGPDDFSSTRGREPAVSPLAATEHLRSTGRGGAGNFRSPSRDVDVRGEAERDAIRAAEARKEGALHSTGRGGAGNISRSRSRGPETSLSPSRAGDAHEVHSSGRGGAGNIAPGPAPAYERGRTGAVEGIHSTGRGGLANLTSAPSPPPDTPVHHLGVYESTGRGGAGNMSRSREPSADASRERPSASRERGDAEKEKGGIAGLWGRLHPNPHPHPHHPHPGPNAHGAGHPDTIQESGGAPGQPVGVEGGLGMGLGVGGRGGVI